MKNEFISKNHSKFLIKYHIIFVCKYRKKLLVGIIRNNIISILKNISDSSNFSIDIMETDKDHIHLLISSVPKLSPLSIVRKLKAQSTVEIWKLHHLILKKHFWKEQTFWTDGYFVSSIGNASIETIQKYIQEQG